MTRQEQLQQAGFNVMWSSGDNSEFYIEDGSVNLYLNFYLNNDNTPKVDVFIITEPKAFNLETFDVINGVPDVTLLEDELWNRVKEGRIIW